MNTYCGDCRYFGSELEPQHICECKESIFKSCAKFASGCDKFERRKEKKTDTLVIKTNCFLNKSQLDDLRKNIFKQMEDGVVLLPQYCRVVRDDIPEPGGIKIVEIRIEESEDKE